MLEFTLSYERTSQNKLESLLIPKIQLSEKLEKQLPIKENFSTFLQLDCSNFWLKLCERP